MSPAAEVMPSCRYVEAASAAQAAVTLFIRSVLCTSIHLYACSRTSIAVVRCAVL